MASEYSVNISLDTKKAEANLKKLRKQINNLDKSSKKTGKSKSVTQEEKILKLTPSYTIQVASWPTYEQARKDQLNLNDLGYDAYLEQFFIKSKNQTWWRVRVGHFTDKE